METILEILNGIDDSIAWETQTALIDERVIDSFAVITMVSELESEFDIEIKASEIIPENFNSVNALWNMVQRLMED